MRKLLLCGAFVCLLACGQERQDREIKADISSKAETMLALAGVRYTVENDTVFLHGYCPTIESRTAVEKKIEKIAGVEYVVNNIKVGPVTLSGNQPLQHSVDSILAHYPWAFAEVEDSVISLHGRVYQNEHPNLLKAIGTLQYKGLLNHLALQ